MFSRVLSVKDVTELYVAGLRKTYVQTRATVDAARSRWSGYRGNEPVPHPVESDTVFTARFATDLTAEQGALPAGGKSARLVPANFGGGVGAATAG